MKTNNPNSLADGHRIIGFKYYVYVRPGHIEYFDDMEEAQEIAAHYGVSVKERWQRKSIMPHGGPAWKKQLSTIPKNLNRLKTMAAK